MSKPDNRAKTSVDNRNIDSTINTPFVYRQEIADSHHDIAKKSNELTALGFRVVEVIPILSGRFIVLGEK